MSGLHLVYASDCETGDGSVTGKLSTDDDGTASLELAGSLMFGMVGESAGEDVVVAAGDLCEFAMESSTSRNLPVVCKIFSMIALVCPLAKHGVLTIPETIRSGGESGKDLSI